MIGKD
jgi:hypothetical protein